MPEKRQVPGSPQEWIARAKGDLALARAPLPEGGFYEDLCFHAHQAAEKALKSVYLRFAWAFRYVHNLEELMTGLRQHGLLVSAEVEEAVVLTSYAFEARYPGLGEAVTKEEYGGLWTWRNGSSNGLRLSSNRSLHDELQLFLATDQGSGPLRMTRGGEGGAPLPERGCDDPADAGARGRATVWGTVKVVGRSK